MVFVPPLKEDMMEDEGMMVDIRPMMEEMERSGVLMDD